MFILPIVLKTFLSYFLVRVEFSKDLKSILEGFLIYQEIFTFDKLFNLIQFNSIVFYFKNS